MWEFLSKLDPFGAFMQTLTIGSVLVGVIAIIAHHWCKVRVTESEALLKQQMLEKGMSAAEIEQVVKASKESVSSQEVKFAGNEAADNAALVKILAIHGYEGEDIERVLRALPNSPDRGLEGDVPITDTEKAVSERAAAVKMLVNNGLSAEEIERVVKAFGNNPGRLPDSKEMVVNRS